MLVYNRWQVIHIPVVIPLPYKAKTLMNNLFH